MPLVTTDAVVLHAFDYLENSRILKLATRDAGLQSVVARGARASQKRFGAGLDLFASGVVQIQSRAGRELQQLAGFDLVRARVALAQDLERFTAASALTELVLRFAGDDQGGELFDALVGALDALSEAPAGTACDVGLAGAWRLVAALGFAPAIDSCCRCHAAIDPLAGASFSHAAGGAACAACAPQLPRGRSLPVAARDALRAWTAGRAAALVDPPERRAHQRLLREFLEYHLADGRALRAFGAWERGAITGATRAPDGVAP
ncbi:MAG: DNA repair protein RecO [Gemmatimonadaceae bacterium]|nr:DNA repair protein RecO [Gemmatimonadaceae bacterium]